MSDRHVVAFDKRICSGRRSSRVFDKRLSKNKKAVITAYYRVLCFKKGGDAEIMESDH
jgi:hypothetical protein